MYKTSEKTVKKALDNLAEDGYLMFMRGRYGGTFVMDIPQAKGEAYKWLAINSDYVPGEVVPRPDNLDEMLSVAERLSQGFPELRVDLYNVQGRIYFGELTFTSQGGFMNSITPEFNLILGSKFDIKDFPSKR